ncbi:MAG: hypothetical protein ACFFC6_05155 [Promethearchaeota archaeon]
MINIEYSKQDVIDSLITNQKIRCTICKKNIRFNVNTRQFTQQHILIMGKNNEYLCIQCYSRKKHQLSHNSTKKYYYYRKCVNPHCKNYFYQELAFLKIIKWCSDTCAQQILTNEEFKHYQARVQQLIQRLNTTTTKKRKQTIKDLTEIDTWLHVTTSIDYTSMYCTHDRLERVRTERYHPDYGIISSIRWHCVKCDMIVEDADMQSWWLQNEWQLQSSDIVINTRTGKQKSLAQVAQDINTRIQQKQLSLTTSSKEEKMTLRVRKKC